MCGRACTCVRVYVRVCVCVRACACVRVRACVCVRAKNVTCYICIDRDGLHCLLSGTYGGTEVTLLTIKVLLFTNVNRNDGGNLSISNSVCLLWYRNIGILH